MFALFLRCTYCCEAIFCNESCLLQASPRGHGENKVCNMRAFRSLEVDLQLSVLLFLNTRALPFPAPLLSHLSNQSPHSLRGATMHTDNLRGVTLHAATLVYSLRQSVSFVKADVSAVIESYFQASCNATTVKERVESGVVDNTSTNANSPRSFQEESIGKALYSVESGINHSCKPNSLVSYDGCTLFLRATEPIENGTEVTHTYGPTISRGGREERRDELRTRYFFECECRGCQEDLSPSSPTSVSPGAFRCPRVGCHCPQIVVGRPCPDCGTGLDWDTALGLQVDFLNDFQVARQKHDQGSSQEALKDLENCLKLAETLYHADNLSLGKVYDLMGEINATRGAYDEAARFVGKSVVIVERVFGSRSIELTHELVKLCELDANRTAIPWEDLPSIEKRVKSTIELCGLYFGEHSEEVREMRDVEAHLATMYRRR